MVFSTFISSPSSPSYTSALNLRLDRGWILLDLVGCCWMVGWCWMLLDIVGWLSGVGCCWTLLYGIGCWMLLDVVVSLHVIACHHVSLHAIKCHCMPSCVIACHCMPSCVIACHCMSLHAIKCHCMSLHDIKCHCMPSCVIACHCMPSSGGRATIHGVPTLPCSLRGHRGLWGVGPQAPQVTCCRLIINGRLLSNMTAT